MGSNPIPPTLVTDTSPLQGLYRGGALDLLRAGGTTLVIPSAVAEETRGSFDQIGGVKVPDLSVHPWIQVVQLTDADLEAEGASLVGPRRRTRQYEWNGLKIQQPELEAILLARRMSVVLLMEDDAGLRGAAIAGVKVAGVADVLRDLVSAGRLDLTDASQRARAILATNYFSQRLEWLSRGITDF